MSYYFFRDKLDPPIVIVHGGAGFWDKHLDTLSGILSESCRRGLSVLETGRTEAESAVSAVEVLEDTCILNAGRGSTLDFYGRISMDAGVMDGSSMDYGSVGDVKYPLHPVRLAYIVMKETSHTFLVGSGADLLAVRAGLEPHPGPCKEVYLRWIERKYHPDRKGFLEKNMKWLEHDTVGAVVASPSNVGAAVSTGGISLKMPGRIGDSPLIGGGFYASGRVGVVATGLGEYISRFLLAYRIVFAYENNGEVTRVFEEFSERFGNDTAGFILASSSGEVMAAYNTRFMPWMACNRDRCIGNLD